MSGPQLSAWMEETDAQLAYLRAQYCDLARGYLFSRPLPPDKCAKLLWAGPRQMAACAQ